MTTLLLLLLSLAVAVEPAQAAAKATVTSFLNSASELSVSQGILAVLAIGVGAVMCIAGYRLFRGAIFVSGFILGGLGVASIVEWLFKSKTWVFTASWVGFLVGGILVGLLVMSIYTTSIFVAGAAAGVLLAFTFNTTVGYRIYPSHPSVALAIFAVILGLLGGMLALKLEKPVLVIATSFVGAVMVTWGIGRFAGHYPNGADLEYYRSPQKIDGAWVYSIPDAWWGYLAGIVVLFGLGMFLQFRKTGRDSSHHRK